jgi:p-cumate 2,3-dioxygenase alpha subunit
VPRFENYRGFLFVNMHAAAEPLVDYLGAAREYLDLVCDQSETGMHVLPGTHKYVVRANWKLCVDNFSDNYHFVILHRRFQQHMREVGAMGPPAPPAPGDFSQGLDNRHAVMVHKGHAKLGRLAGKWGPVLPEWAKEPVAARGAELEARLGPERAARIMDTNRILRIFPNLGVLDTQVPSIRWYIPVNVETTEVHEWILAPPGEREDLRRIRVRNEGLSHGPASFVNSDDVEVLAFTQTGLASNPEVEWVDGSRGMKLRRTLPSDEQGFRALHRYWHELVTNRRITHPETC